jgi:hypothetical protein
MVVMGGRVGPITMAGAGDGDIGGIGMFYLSISRFLVKTAPRLAIYRHTLIYFSIMMVHNLRL